MIPAIKKLYPDKDDQIAALKRHLEFYNTHPYVSAPVIGVTLALEEGRANGEPIDDQTIQGVKVGMKARAAAYGHEADDEPVPVPEPEPVAEPESGSESAVDQAVGE